MPSIARALLLFSAVLYSGFALSQGVKLGAVLDRNAAKLAKDEVVEVVSGTNMVFTVTNPYVNAYVENNWDVLADGKLTALQMRPVRQAALRGYGKWHVRDDGQFCVDIDWPQTNFTGCSWFFKVGDEVWSSRSDSDREAIAIKRSMTKLR